MIVEVFADGEGVIMNQSSDNLILPKRTWKKFGLKRKRSESGPKTLDYGSRGSLSFPSEVTNASRHSSSRRSDNSIVSPEPSVFSEESIRRFKSTSSDEEDDESDQFCHKSSKIYKIVINVFKFLIGKVLRVGVVLSVLIIPFVMLIIGSVYWKDCPREWRVPLFLVLGGAMAVSSNLINTAQYIYKKRRELRHSVDLNRSTTSSVAPGGVESEDDPRTSGNFSDLCRNKLPCQMIGFFISIIHTLAIGLFFTGCVWVYGAYDYSNEKYFSLYGRNFTTLNSDYCHPGLYSFAFWILNLCFGLIFFSFFVGLTHYVITSIRLKKAELKARHFI